MVLRTPGAARFSTAGFIGRMPLSMVGLGIVLLVTARGQNYAVAGLISATFAIAAAIGGPLVAGLVDRQGQHIVLPRAAAAHVLCVVLLILALDTQQSLGLTLPLAAAAGAVLPSMGSLIRARWSFVVRDAAELHTAFSWESVLDEVVFIVGPPLATMLALRVHPTAALIAAALMLAVGAALLTPLRVTEPPPHGRVRRAAQPVLQVPGMAVVVAIFVLVGGIFGSFEVVTVGYAEQAGHPESTGLLLALYAVGSLSAGLVYGARASPARHGRRLLAALSFMAVVTLGLPLAPSLPAVGAACLLAGLAVSPVLISGTAFVERIVPSSRLTEGITWSTTGLALGVGLAAPLSGYAIDTWGAHHAYWITAICAILSAAVGWASSQRLASAEEQALQRTLRG